MKLTDLKEFFKQQENYYLLYILCLFAYFTYNLVQWPIYAGDSDLWYHLNGGRYILEHGFIPKDSSFFSFIEPPREWVDYYWLFQVLVYKIYSFADYYGLVFFRAIVFIAILFIVYLILTEDLNRKVDLYTAMLLSLFLLMFFPRFHLVRPHIFTYFFIVFSIYLLEFKRKYVFLLPIIGIFWVNLHGVAYPILLLIVLAYLTDLFLNHVINRQHLQKNEFYYVILLVFTIATVFFTPHGAELMSVPFVPTGFASHYIQELKSINTEELLSLQMMNFIPSLGTIFNLLIIATAFGSIVSIVNKNYNLRHYILLLGAVYLLTKSGRFRYEFVMLVLPIIAHNKISLDLNTLRNKATKIICIFVLLILMIIPFNNVSNIFDNMPKYPFSERNLPAGVVKFLRHIDVGGRVLNNPNYGGYLQWMLYPKYKIFMDMEVPFLFTNEDMFLAVKMFNDKDFFKKVTEKYDPSFIIISHADKVFQGVVKLFPEYRIVFFDDMDVLYVNENHFPEIAKNNGLHVIDPFVFTGQSVEYLQKSNKSDEMLNELLRMDRINPDSGIINQAIAVIYNKKSEYQNAIGFAEKIVKNYPESPAGYKAMGDCLKGLKKYNEAIAYYKVAIKKGGSMSIQKDIGLIYLLQKRYKDAYYALAKVMNIYSPNVTYRDMYDLIDAAILSGNAKDAEILFRYAFASLPDWDREWIEKYKNLETVINDSISNH